MDIEGGEADALFASLDLLKERHPTLYISLHIPWIADKQDFFRKLKEVLSVYKHTYLSNMVTVSLNDIMNLTMFETIIATNE
jgi:hypothetical protein